MSIDDVPAQRAVDEDDYDLLTYGEVAARLSELLTEEHALLDSLRADEPAGAAAITAQERRIAQLTEARDRYRHQKQTAEAFLRKFGLAPRDAS